MTVNKRKKNSRQRGSWTHGWGEKKKHRGTGNRGGRGMAGTGKRGDAKKPSIWKEKYFGKAGFVKKNKKLVVCQNTGYLESNLDRLVMKKFIAKEKEYYVVDSEKMGFNKLLGRGKVSNRFKVNVQYASKKAIEIIKNAGGIIICEPSESSEANDVEKED